MRAYPSKSSLLRCGFAASILLLTSGAALAQSTVSLTAAPTQALLPDGQSVPMWGYACTAGAAPVNASCAAANPAAGANWSPVVITVPYTADSAGVSTASLTINLTNNLSFGAAPNNIPTSIVIDGQLGGGLGAVSSPTSPTGATFTPSPDHSQAQSVTWPSADPSTVSAPPTQGPRVQSFATEVAAAPATATPAPTPTALTWSKLRPGTYLLHSGTHPSIQHPMGLYGILVVTAAPASNTATGTAYGLNTTPVTYAAELPVVLSEIDPVQNRAVDAAVRTAGFSETRVWSGLSLPGSTGSGCGAPLLADGLSPNPAYNTCYPPAVNYDPRYYLINGTSFDASNPTGSMYGAVPAQDPTLTTPVPVLVRFVNAGLHMHVPSIVGATTSVGTTPIAGMALVAEDGNVLPGLPRIQNDVFLAAGKTYDVLVNGPIPTALPVFDRQLSLSTNNQRNGGMLAYLTTQPPAAGLLPTGPVAAQANPDTYYVVSGNTLTVSDPSKGVLANDVGVYGASVAGTPPAGLAFNADGTFSYTGGPTTFGYCGNGAAPGNAALCTTVTLADCTAASGCLGGAPTANPDFYSSTVGPTAGLPARLHVAPPGVLANDTDPSGLPLTVDLATVASQSASLQVEANADGSFTATLAKGASTAAPYTFTYGVKNAQGTAGTAPATVTLTFPAASNLAVQLLDAITGLPITSQDYRWIIEEDRTFFVDPACQVNSTDPSLRPLSCGPLPVQSLGYSFHTANMPVVATGCVGPVSCETGQKLLGVQAACDLGNGACRTGTGVSKAPLEPSQVALDPAKRYYLTVMPADGINPTLNGTGSPVQVDSSCDPASPAGCAMRPFRTEGGANNLGDCTSFVASTDPNLVGNCGHNMGGAQISGATVAANGATATQVNVRLQRTPLPTAQITVFVFQDDYPLNGENDPSGPPGASGPAPNEAGLGGFNVVLFDQAGGLGDNTGQPTYDMFNMPLTNSLNGTIDPMTGLNACPISKNSDNLIGVIPTCPRFEADASGNATAILSPLVGQAIIRNLYPGLYEVQAFPAADRIARGEEWLQTNTLDGGKPHEAFIKPNEPGYFQEFGPGGFHVSVGFANPKIINDRLRNSQKTGMCDGRSDCTANLYGQVTGTHMSRTPDQRTFSSGDYTMYGFTQCYIGIGVPDSSTFALAKCDQDGKFQFLNIPPGDYMLTVFDQWNDIMLDGLVNQVCVGTHDYTTNGQNGGTRTPCQLDGNGAVIGSSPANRLVFPVTQWRTNLYTRTFLDTNGDGVSNLDAGGNPTEPGLPLVSTNIRYRDGSFGFFNNTDLDGFAGFNEVFPFMNWLVAETTSTRYKQTGTHTVYDAGGVIDGSVTGGWTSSIAAGLANTQERVSLPQALRAPGAVYCTSADCTGQSIATGGYYPLASGTSANTGPLAGLSSARIDPPQPWGPTMGFQGLLGQSVFMEFGMRPLAPATATQPAENGGIQGHVIYASTRPFDDPALLLQLSWEPGVPRVKINLYQEGTATDGSQTLKLVDTTTTTSWDDWAQGFRKDASGNLISATYSYTDATGVQKTVTGKVPNMNCPGQDPSSPFFQTLKGSTQWLDQSNPKLVLAADSLFKCYDGWSQLNQVQPAPYDGKYTFPSVVAVDPATGRPAGSGTAVSAGGGAQPGTNCTTCVANPVDGTPMLPAGKYVVEVVVPPGFELVKEEDKNILMGDIYVAPVTQQFAGLGNVFILPDQAAVNAHYNKNSALNPTDNLGSLSFPRHEGDTGSVEAYWPCVGARRIVPDFNSLYPGAGQNAPFAGALRPLCDRKEVTLEPQSTVLAKFYVFTPAHIAGHFTGTITNDFASEFDPFSPQFGEKFGPPNLPVGLRDFSGNEVGRVYSDQWGIYNGLYFSSWEVNPPNPTGYAPQMAIACMNDPGPIPRRNAAGQFLDAGGGIVATAAQAQQVTDPSYNPAYSNFCYETPFMPGFTAYMDTPVIPTQAFADGYNLPDTEYPDGTPAIDSVGGSAIGASGVVGPWVSGGGQTLTITCLGHANADPCSKVVQNPDFSGPGSSTDPYNRKTIVRHYGFGASTGTVALVGADGVAHPLTGVTWTNTTITGTVPAGDLPPLCPLQQITDASTLARASQRCGELVITTATGKRSIDAATVTVGGPTPTVVSPASPSANTFGAVLSNPLQTAIDNATPGDLIIVAPGTYKEHLIMWKPVRLQGVGAGSVTINADAHPAGSLDQWRRQVDCLFGLSINGVPVSPDTHETSFDPTGQYTCPAGMFLRSDRIAFEPIVGWDATGNGNLAQVLQEPTLMGAYEGAGVTVVGRGVKIPASSTDFWGIQTALAGGVAGAFPDGSVYLTGGAADCRPGTATGRDYGTANFLCNPSRIDGLSITNSSQGGGGIFMHGWNHNLEVANTRIFGNHGTLTGGVNLGNGETPGAYSNDGVLCGPGLPGTGPLCPPIPAGTVANELIPLQINTHVRVHHNMIYNNAGIGDALFSGTPSGAGGVTISTGGDWYRLDHNWIAGNLSTGDGGGVEHSGQSFFGQIDHNYILFNQSTNPTLPTNGGGLGVIGANNPRTLNGQECGTLTDADCPPGLGDGTGKGLVIDANLILGNSAESGSGGGVRLQQVNGTELTALPLRPDRWYDVTFTNNIIVNNVAGWDGAGVSMEDAFKVSVVNNTIASNDTTASAGVLFKTLGAISAASTAPGCTPTTDPTLPQNQNCLIPNAAHVPQPAGLVTSKNTPNMVDALTTLTVACPAGFGYTGGAFGFNASCRQLSLPLLANNLFWQNRAFHVEITGPGSNLLSQQNLVAMVPVLNQATTGDCAASGLAADLQTSTPVFYWDVGVRDDVVPNDGIGGARLAMQGSILTPGVTYGVPAGGTPNVYPTSSPVVRQYCNGARVPPENGGHGFLSPPGSSETTGLAKLFAFNNIQPAATVDEGHNWINLTYGPLTLSSTANGAFATAGTAMLATVPTGPTLGAYSIGGSSLAVDAGNSALAPSLDFFGNPRPKTRANQADIGAVEYQTPTVPVVTVNPSTLSFAGTLAGTNSANQTLTLVNNGGAPFTGLTVAVATASATTNGTFSRNGGTCGGALPAGGTCTILIRYAAPGTAGLAATGSVTITGNVAVTNSPVALTGSSSAPTHLASIGPSPIAFGNWATGTTSNTLNLSVLNTGNSPLAGGTFTLGGGAPQPFTRVNGGTFPAGAPNCGAALAVGATCTVKLQFTPPSAITFSRTLTVAYTGATVSPATVTLTGTGVATRATVAITPNPFTITLPSTGSTAASQIGTVTLTNTAPTGGSQVLVTGVATSQPGGTGLQYAWTSGAAAGPDTCTGASLAPGQSCTASVRFTLLLAPRGATPRLGTVTFTDSGAASPQAGALIGIASQAAVAFRNGTVDPTCAGASVTTLAWGTATTPLTACLVNTGNGDLNVTLETVANLTGGAQFSLGTQLPTACAVGGTVPPGGFCTVVINRARPAAGVTAGTGNLSITDTGVAAPTIFPPNNAPTTTQALSLGGT